VELWNSLSLDGAVELILGLGEAVELSLGLGGVVELCLGLGGAVELRTIWNDSVSDFVTGTNLSGLIRASALVGPITSLLQL
jgi:hypothetical protein